MQEAGIAALTGPQESVEERRATYERRRDRAYEALRGVEAQSQGTFFVWFRLPAGVTAESLLVEHRVAVQHSGPVGAAEGVWRSVGQQIVGAQSGEQGVQVGGDVEQAEQPDRG